MSDNLAGLSDLGRFEAFRIPQEWSKVRLVLDHLRCAARRRVYTRCVYSSHAFLSRLDSALDGSFDVVHLDSLDLVDLIPRIRQAAPDVPIACTHHNVESALLRRRAAAASGLGARYLARQADLYEREERSWVPRLDLNVAVSANDRDDLRELAGGGTFAVVPNGVDTDFFRPDPDASVDEIGFLGGTEWEPNVDAMEYFGREVLPRLRGSGVDAKVSWIGRASEPERRRFAEEYGIEMTGYVTDVREHLGRARCLVVPLRSGGGTRLKITTAWAMGLPVVSTSLGAEGLDARDGENVLLADEPAAFADAVERVLRDASLRERLRRGARETAVQTYSWDVVGDILLDAYEELLEPSSAVSS